MCKSGQSVSTASYAKHQSSTTNFPNNKKPQTLAAGAM